MKILANYKKLEDFESIKNPSFYSMPDNTIIRNNDNFFIPNFCTEISIQIGIYIQLSKIGKHIEPKFIKRYYSNYGVAINFIAKPVFNTLLSQLIPTNTAFDFDNSFAISTQSVQTNSIEIHTAEFSVQYNNKDYSFSLSNSIDSIQNLLSESSKYYTFKIGDLFFIPIIDLDSIIKANDVIDIFINNNHMLQTKIV